MVFVLTKYVLKRLVYIVVVFFIVSFLMYCLFSLIPSDRARTQLEPLKQQLKPEVYEQMYRDLREQMGLDDPIILRYLRWMGLAKDKMTGEFNGILEGYFGYSQMRQRDAIDVIKAPMGNTILFNLVTTILTLAVTIPLGIWCSVHKNSKFDQGVQAVTILGYSIPQYIIALIFVFVFAVLLRWFPVNGAATPGANYTGLRGFADRMYIWRCPSLSASSAPWAA